MKERFAKATNHIKLTLGDKSMGSDRD